MIPFNKIVTIYHQTKTDTGIVWTKTIYDRVYYSISKRLVIAGDVHSYVDAHCLVIPYDVNVAIGDIARIGSCDINLVTNSSAKEVLRNGGWIIKTANQNTYPNHSLNHWYLSDV